MKKLIAFVLIIVTLAIAFASCAGENTPEATTYNYYTSKITPVATTATESITPTEGTIYVNEPTESTTEATIASTTATTGTTTPAEVFVPKGNGNLVDTHYIETKSKILFLKGLSGVGNEYNPLYYYSKADGELYPFCFDPFCEHIDASAELKIKCVGTAMSSPIAKPPANADPVYLDSRIYFVYFDAIYSCSEFATDLRLEYSFHEYDHLTITEILGRYNHKIFAICDFCGYGSSLLFKHIDENGNIIQYIFDIKTKKLSSLTEKIKEAGERLGVSLYISQFTNEKIFFEAYTNVKREPSVTGSFIVAGDFMGCYESDYELNEIKKIDFRVPSNPIFKTQNGFVFDETRNGKSGLYSIMFDGSEKVIFEDYDSELNCVNTRFAYLTDNSMYYFGEDPVEMGIDESLFGDVRKNQSGGKLYRYDLNTGKSQLVLDDVRYDGFEVYYIGKDDNVVLMRVQKYEKISATKVKTTGGVIIKGTLDANGNFVDIEEVELE